MNAPLIDPFTQGVRWGLFLSEVHSDAPKADYWRAMTLLCLVDQVDMTPDAPMRELRQVIVDEWDARRCHGALAPGEVCPDCETYNPDSSDA